jgi:hypothetical protein
MQDTFIGRLFPVGQMDQFDAPWLKIYKKRHSELEEPKHEVYCL